MPFRGRFQVLFVLAMPCTFSEALETSSAKRPHQLSACPSLYFPKPNRPFNSIEILVIAALEFLGFLLASVRPNN